MNRASKRPFSVDGRARGEHRRIGGFAEVGEERADRGWLGEERDQAHLALADRKTQHASADPVSHRADRGLQRTCGIDRERVAGAVLADDGTVNIRVGPWPAIPQR